MKIRLNQIPSDGIVLEEKISPGELDLNTEDIKVYSPIKVKAEIYRISNAVTVNLLVSAQITTECGRCLKETNIDLNKIIKLNYQVDSQEQYLDLDQDIREELILEYPLRSLCKPDCKGLCPKCGKSLNEGGCSCGST